MAKYANLSDIKDNTITVLEEDLLEADRVIDNRLYSLGVNPENIAGNNFLKDVAVKYACYIACVRESAGENTLYLEKSKQYKEMFKELIENLSLSTLGITSTTGTVKVFRG